MGLRDKAGGWELQPPHLPDELGTLMICFSLSTSVAPRIVVDPKPTTTDIGSDVTLTCVWVGNPPLTLTWTKKDSNMVRSSPPLLNPGR